MTDKQLKQLLTPTPHDDEEFVQKVMRQLPKTDLSWRPIWTIRVVALIIGMVILVWSQELMPVIHDVLTLSQGSWTMMLLAGLLVASGTLWICKEKEII